MNYIQFILFFIFAIGAFLAGLPVYSRLTKEDSLKSCRSIFLGEVLLIGSILIYAGLMIVSMLGLYTVHFIWGVVGLAYLAIFDKNSRDEILALFKKEAAFSLPVIVFIVMAAVFFYRNCYFLMDVDSHTAYLLTQKIWLENKTSLIGSPALDLRVYVAQFDAVFYGLGLSVFPRETLFPQLINTFFRLIAVLLVFGYTNYRFNKWYGLAASMYMFFNIAFHISGANRWVVLNGALVALIFAASYSMWEGRAQKSNARFLLALVFLLLIPSNKYQGLLVAIFIFALGMFVQRNPLKQIVGIFKSRFYVSAFALFVVIAALHFIKNWIATGCPSFPIFAGQFNALNHTPEMDAVFRQYTKGVDLNLFTRYFGYLFLWHDIIPERRVIYVLIYLPFIILMMMRRNKVINYDVTFEFMYWLALSIASVFGICILMFQDPRYYVFPLGVMVFTTIFAVHYIFRECLKVRVTFIIVLFMIFFATPWYKIYTKNIDEFSNPTYKQNWEVVTDKIHTSDVVSIYYPRQNEVDEAIRNNPDKFAKSAWYFFMQPNRHSSFLSPIRPYVSVLTTSIISWESYESEEKVINDLKAYGIKWLIDYRDDKVVFIPVNDFAKEMVVFDRYPKKVQYDYGFPEELTRTKYAK